MGFFFAEIPMHPKTRPEQPAGTPWNDDASGEPTSNRGAGDTTAPAGHEFENGSRGEKSGKNQEQEAQVRGKP